VEQDLIICRAVIELFSRPVLREQLAFRGEEAYINVDQGHFTVSVAGETLFTGDPAEHPRLKRCVSED